MKNRPGRAPAPMILALALVAPNLALAASPGGFNPNPGTRVAPAPPEPARPKRAASPAAKPPVPRSRRRSSSTAKRSPRRARPPAFRRSSPPPTDPHQALYLGRRPRLLVRERLRLLGRGQLRAARRQALACPLDLGSTGELGRAGAGRWITVYANGGHAYAVIAGLRWDTAGNARGHRPSLVQADRGRCFGPVHGAPPVRLLRPGLNFPDRTGPRTIRLRHRNQRAGAGVARARDLLALRLRLDRGDLPRL